MTKSLVIASCLTLAAMLSSGRRRREHRRQQDGAGIQESGQGQRRKADARRSQGPAARGEELRPDRYRQGRHRVARRDLCVGEESRKGNGGAGQSPVRCRRQGSRWNAGPRRGQDVSAHLAELRQDRCQQRRQSVAERDQELRESTTRSQGRLRSSIVVESRGRRIKQPPAAPVELAGPHIDIQRRHLSPRTPRSAFASRPESRASAHRAYAADDGIPRVADLRARAGAAPVAQVLQTLAYQRSCLHAPLSVGCA